MTVGDVNRKLRQTLWRTLESRGFTDRTQRSAWRHRDDGIDVVDILSVGAGYDSVGCTSFSFSAVVGSSPLWAKPTEAALEPRALRRPHYWDCHPFECHLQKTLKQPWFKPFTRPAETLTEPMRVHREGLRQVFRSDVHDRPDIWYVLDDGTNLDEVLEDVSSVVLNEGLPTIERFHDPREVIEMLQDGRLRIMPDSPTGQAIFAAAHGELARRETAGSD